MKNIIRPLALLITLEIGFYLLSSGPSIKGMAVKSANVVALPAAADDSLKQLSPSQMQFVEALVKKVTTKSQAMVDGKSTSFGSTMPTLIESDTANRYKVNLSVTLEKR